jgi:hypothetical protein
MLEALRDGPRAWTEADSIGVYPPGTEVEVGPDDGDVLVKAVVHEVVIRHGPAVWYEVAWWREGNRHALTVPDFEVRGTSPKPIRICGFKGAP